MSGLASYFVREPNKLIPQNKFIVKGKNYRFSVLTPRLIRLEYSQNGIFEDRATSLVVNRTFNDCQFSVSSNETTLNIATEYFSLTYVKESPLTSKTIKVKVNGTDKEWSPNHQDVRNCGSLSYSLDDLDDKFKLSNGLYSMSGYAEINDSNNFVIDKDNIIKREGATDIYLFVYRTDLGLCLQDYFNLTGYPPMIPRYTLGSWWYKNDRYNMYEIDETLKKFHDNHIPISIFLLGDKWHNNIENYLITAKGTPKWISVSGYDILYVRKKRNGRGLPCMHF